MQIVGMMLVRMTMHHAPRMPVQMQVPVMRMSVSFLAPKIA